MTSIYEKRFLGLLNPDAVRIGSGLSVGEQQDNAAKQFPSLVRSSKHLHLWNPEEQFVEPIRRILLGLASYSTLDMRLADVVEENRSQGNVDRVDVFDVSLVKTIDVLHTAYPVKGEFVSTLLAGFWKGGELTAFGQGHQAVRIVRRLLEIDQTPEEIFQGLASPPRM